jgi:transcriptional regulator
MSTKMQVEWRRAKVLEMLSKGDSQSEIAKVLQVDISIISRDVYFLRQQAKDNIKKYIDERLRILICPRIFSCSILHCIQ